MPRSWGSTRIEPAATGFTVLLEGRPVRLPSGRALCVRPRPLALAIAAEWRAAKPRAGGQAAFADTPLTRLAGTAQERIAGDPRPTVDAIARYGETDMLCYRAEAPMELVRHQALHWQPWLDWAAAEYAAPLRTGAGVAPICQHQDSTAALRRAVAGFDAYRLAGLGLAVPALGSLVLGLALAAGRLDAGRAYRLGALDELFQAERWGEDALASARRAAIAADITLAARFMALARDEAASA